MSAYAEKTGKAVIDREHFPPSIAGEMWRLFFSDIRFRGGREALRRLRDTVQRVNIEFGRRGRA